MILLTEKHTCHASLPVVSKEISIMNHSWVLFNFFFWGGGGGGDEKNVFKICICFKELYNFHEINYQYFNSKYIFWVKKFVSQRKANKTYPYKQNLSIKNSDSNGFVSG